MEELAAALHAVVRRARRENPRRFVVNGVVLAPRTAATAPVVPGAQADSERFATLRVTVRGDALPTNSPYRNGVFPLEIRLCQPLMGPPLVTAVRFASDIYHPLFTSREGVDHTNPLALPSLHAMSPRLWRLLEEVWHELEFPGQGGLEKRSALSRSSTATSSLPRTPRSSNAASQRVSISREMKRTPGVFGNKASSLVKAVDEANPSFRMSANDESFEALFTDQDSTALFAQRLRREGRRIDVATKALASPPMSPRGHGQATTRVHPRFLYTRSLAFQYRNRLGAQLFEAFDGNFSSGADIITAPISAFPAKAKTAGMRIGSTLPDQPDAFYGPPSIAAPPVPLGDPILHDTGPAQEVVRISVRGKRYHSGPGVKGGYGAVVSFAGIGYMQKREVSFLPGGYSLLLLSSADLSVLHYAQYSSTHPSGLREFLTALTSRPDESIAVAFVAGWRADGVRDAAWLSSMGVDGASILRKCGCRMWPDALDESKRASRLASLYLRERSSDGANWDRLSRISRRRADESRGSKLGEPLAERHARHTVPHVAATSKLKVDCGLALVCKPRSVMSNEESFCVERLLRIPGVGGARTETRAQAALVHDTERYCLIDCDLMPKMSVVDVIEDIGESWHWPSESLVRMQRVELELFHCHAFISQYRPLLWNIFAYYALLGMNNIQEMAQRQWVAFIMDCHFEIHQGADGHVLKSIDGEDALTIFRDAHHEILDAAEEIAEMTRRLAAHTNDREVELALSSEGIPLRGDGAFASPSARSFASPLAHTRKHTGSMSLNTSSSDLSGHAETIRDTARDGLPRDEMPLVSSSMQVQPRSIARQVVTLVRWRTGQYADTKAAPGSSESAGHAMKGAAEEQRLGSASTHDAESTSGGPRGRRAMPKSETTKPTMSSSSANAMSFDAFCEAVIRVGLRCLRYQQQKNLGLGLRKILNKFIHDNANRLPTDPAFDAAYRSAREVRALAPYWNTLQTLFKECLELLGPRAEYLTDASFIGLLKRCSMFGGNLSLSKALTSFVQCCGFRENGSHLMELDFYGFVEAMCRCAQHWTFGDTARSGELTAASLAQTFGVFLWHLNGRQDGEMQPPAEASTESSEDSGGAANSKTPRAPRVPRSGAPRRRSVSGVQSVPSPRGTPSEPIAEEAPAAIAVAEEVPAAVAVAEEVPAAVAFGSSLATPQHVSLGSRAA